MIKQRELSKAEKLTHSTSKQVRQLKKEATLFPEENFLAEAEIAKQTLLQEVSLNHANVLNLIFKLFSDNPFITREEITQIIKDSLSIINPKLMDSFLDVVEQTFNDIQIYIKILKEDLGNNATNAELANAVFKSIIKDKNIKKLDLDESVKNGFLNSKKRIEFTSFGAVLFVTDPEAYSLIDPRTNIGGNFGTLDHKITIDKGKYYNIVIPIIVVKGESLLVKSHEIGHSETRYIREALIGQKSREEQNNQLDMIWGEHTSITKASSNLNVLIRAYNKKTSIDQLKELEELDSYNVIISYCLQCAKDELIAEMKDNSGDPSSYMDNLKNINGPYNYITKNLGLEKYNELFTFLNDSYQAKLDSYTKTALAIYDTYNTQNDRGHWKKRKSMFAYVLLTTPLERWHIQMERLGYNKEVSLASKCEELLTNFKDQFDIIHSLKNGDLIKRNHFDNNFLTKIQPLQLKLDLLLETDSDHSCLSQLYKIEKEIIKAIAEFKKRDEYELINIATDYTAKVNKIEFFFKKLDRVIPVECPVYKEMTAEFKKISNDVDLSSENIDIIITEHKKLLQQLEKLETDLDNIFTKLNDNYEVVDQFFKELHESIDVMKIKPIPQVMTIQWEDDYDEIEQVLDAEKLSANTVEDLLKILDLQNKELTSLIARMIREKVTFRIRRTFVPT